ncbi:FAD:protein FMN transferase [Catellatospora tritici]|uniref:FAD:protein FMN transferase n=1 Tax=Catellatospora tritici TaxID=2851566 RepID=UPI001C2D41DE|nr:FAD:protein FMN transferase [Catellatospora tritici]MBV1853918.1 FAD:protein FMN transferase [Catellatospora tritici]
MGTAISVDLADDAEFEVLFEGAAQAFAWFREVDERFSTYKEHSEVSRLRRGEITAAQGSADLRQVLAACADLWSETGGFFDASATGRLDPSGYVKGWSVQVASDRLTAAGLVNHCINAGGDVCVRGRPAPDRSWRVGIQHPWERGRLAWVLSVGDAAVATSGTYERGLHVVDPFTGQPAAALRSVTVVGTDLGSADAYATAAFAMGRAGIDWLAARADLEWAVIAEDGQAYRSPGLPLAADDATLDTESGLHRG